MAEHIIRTCAIVMACASAVCVASGLTWYALRAVLSARGLLGDFLAFEARQRSLRAGGARWRLKLAGTTVEQPVEVRETTTRYAATAWFLNEPFEGVGETADDAAYEAMRALAKRLSGRLDTKLVDVVRGEVLRG